MAKIDLKFLDSKDKSWIKSKSNMNYEGEKVIEIDLYNCYSLDVSKICLDKPTAVRFAKTLRTEIAKITAEEKREEGLSNG